MSKAVELSKQSMSEVHESSTKSVMSSTKTTSQSMSYKSSSQKVVTSSGHPDSGMDMDAEIEKMKLKLDTQMERMKMEMFSLAPGAASELIKLDNKSLQQYICGDHKDRAKLDLDMHEFAQESVVVKQVGNKVEVHAKKHIKVGSDEKQEEYSRMYELPEGADAKMVTSSLNKDAKTLTIELPVGAIEF